MTDDLPDPPIADSVDPVKVGDQAPADSEPSPIDDTVLLPDEDEEEADSGDTDGGIFDVAPRPPFRIVDGVRADAAPVMPEREDIPNDPLTDPE